LPDYNSSHVVRLLEENIWFENYQPSWVILRMTLIYILLMVSEPGSQNAK